MSERRPPLLVQRGVTLHRRFTPFRSQFAYRVAMVDIDIDRLKEADAQCAAFAVERPALFSFSRKNHGRQEDASLRDWADEEFRKAGIDAEDAQIRLVTFPRHLLYKFAPLSLWIALDADNSPMGILYEVRNTFGERHTYAAALQGSWNRHEAPKQFHVSPFFDVSGQYLFSLRYDDSGLKLGVTTRESGKPLHLATLDTQALPATSRKFAEIAVAMPFSSLGVTLAIHWEALKLWVKGARYHKKPALPSLSSTCAVAGAEVKEEQRGCPAKMS